MFVEVSPELAEERGIQSGTWVQLTSRYGQVRVRALVTDRVQGRQLYMPMKSTRARQPADRQPHGLRDPHARLQGDRGADARVAGDLAKANCHACNHRFGHPTPQRGVEVERKWQRPDYRIPGSRPGQTATDIKKRKQNNGSPDSFGAGAARCA